MKPNLNSITNLKTFQPKKDFSKQKSPKKKSEIERTQMRQTQSSDLTLVSPSKSTKLPCKPFTESQKNIQDQITKFDFSFKKKNKPEDETLQNLVMKQLCSKLSLNSDAFEAEDLRLILQFRSSQLTQFFGSPSYRVSQSAVLLCQLLRGKINQNLSFASSLKIIWGNSFSKKELVQIIKAVDYRMVVESPCQSPRLRFSKLQKDQFLSLKVSFVNVMFFADFLK